MPKSIRGSQGAPVSKGISQGSTGSKGKAKGTVQTIGQHTICTLTLPNDPHATHQLFLRPYTPKPSPKPSSASLPVAKNRKAFPPERTLVVGNVPVDGTESSLRALFAPCGTVERVFLPSSSTSKHNPDTAADSDADSSSDTNSDEGSEGDRPSKIFKAYDEKTSRKKQRAERARVPILHPLPPIHPITQHTGSTAHVLFTDSISLTRALTSFPLTRHRWTTPEVAGMNALLGRWRALRPPPEAIKKHADSVVALWEYRQALEKSRVRPRTEHEERMEDDGFTLVTRGGQFGRSGKGEMGVGVARKVYSTDPVPVQKKKPKQLENFYGFQRREAKRKELAELREKFEEDKQKLQKLSSASRRFQPY